MRQSSDSADPITSLEIDLVVLRPRLVHSWRPAPKEELGSTVTRLGERRSMSDRRVLLAFPVFAHVLPKAFDNFLKIIAVASRVCPAIKFDPWVKERSSVTGAMNEAVDIALEHGHEAIIAFDDDCIPELIDYPAGTPERYQVIPRLLALLAKGHKIVAGVGYMRGYPHTTTIGRHYPWGTSLVLDAYGVDGVNLFKGFHWIDDLDLHKDEFDEDGLLAVDFCGVPVMAIHRDVLTTIPKPLFETHDEITGGGTTHDIYFCNKAREHGFAIKVDTHIDCGHIVESPIINRRNKITLRAAIAGGAVPELRPRDGSDTERGELLPDVRQPVPVGAT
jgi:hypothetical protein